MDLQTLRFKIFNLEIDDKLKSTWDYKAWISHPIYNDNTDNIDEAQRIWNSTLITEINRIAARIAYYSRNSGFEIMMDKKFRYIIPEYFFRNQYYDELSVNDDVLCSRYKIHYSDCGNNIFVFSNDFYELKRIMTINGKPLNLDFNEKEYNLSPDFDVMKFKPNEGFADEEINEYKKTLIGKINVINII